MTDAVPFDDESVLASIRAALAYARAIPPDLTADLSEAERVAPDALANFRMHAVIEALCAADTLLVKHPTLKPHALLRAFSGALMSASATIAAAVKRQSGETLDAGRFALVAYSNVRPVLDLPWSAEIDAMCSLREPGKLTADRDGPGEELIHWHRVRERLPDANTTVLIDAPTISKPVWLGWYCDGDWFAVDGSQYAEGTVLRWADMPKGTGS